MHVQGHLFSENTRARLDSRDVLSELAAFTWQGRATAVETVGFAGAAGGVPVLTNEFWTSRQRAAHSLHEISYRACFKPQLPAFFVRLLSQPGDTVYDPFAGRGTTLLEASLLDRVPAGCDVNPLSRTLILPRLLPPTLQQVVARLDRLNLTWGAVPKDLLTFYHQDTLQELCALRAYLIAREADGTLDDTDDWIRMVALNRLTGHSPGFLSVYTLPPNQAVTVDSQKRINTQRNLTPPRREVRRTIVRKTATLLAEVDDLVRERLQRARRRGRFQTGSCTDPFWEPESVRLIVASPPFLDVVDYATDNWLRGWFYGIEVDRIPIEMHRRLEDWRSFVERAFRQFARLLQPAGFVAFEVGEVRRGRVRLEDEVIPCGVRAGFTPVAVLINQQVFTKTANIWGVSNNARGTNTNRIVLFQQPLR